MVSVRSIGGKSLLVSGFFAIFGAYGFTTCGLLVSSFAGFTGTGFTYGLEVSGLAATLVAAALGS